MPLLRRKTRYSIGVDFTPSENHTVRFAAVILSRDSGVSTHIGTLQGWCSSSLVRRLLFALTRVGEVIVERNGPNLNALESKVGWGCPNIYYKTNVAPQREEEDGEGQT